MLLFLHHHSGLGNIMDFLWWSSKNRPDSFYSGDGEYYNESTFFLHTYCFVFTATYNDRIVVWSLSFTTCVNSVGLHFAGMPLCKWLQLVYAQVSKHDDSNMLRINKLYCFFAGLGHRCVVSTIYALMSYRLERLFSHGDLVLISVDMRKIEVIIII